VREKDTYYKSMCAQQREERERVDREKEEEKEKS